MTAVNTTATLHQIDIMLRHKLSAGLLRASRPLVTPSVPLPGHSAGLASAVLLSSQKKWQNETVVKLKDELKRRGLSQYVALNSTYLITRTGNKSTLISRLTASESAAFPIPTPPKSSRSMSSKKDTTPKQAVTDTEKVVADVQVSAAAAEAPKVDKVTKEQEEAVPGLPKLTSALEADVEKKGNEVLDVKFPQAPEDKEAEQMIVRRLV